MSVNPIDLTGGKSVYCFNQNQLDRAEALAREDSPAGGRIRAEIARLETECTRNERAAIAFLLIQRLNASAG
jgi:hypothetical protein